MLRQDPALPETQQVLINDVSAHCGLEVESVQAINLLTRDLSASIGPEEPLNEADSL